MCPCDVENDDDDDGNTERKSLLKSKDRNFESVQEDGDFVGWNYRAKVMSIFIESLAHTLGYGGQNFDMQFPAMPNSQVPPFPTLFKHDLFVEARAVAKPSAQEDGVTATVTVTATVVSSNILNIC